MATPLLILILFCSPTVTSKKTYYEAYARDFTGPVELTFDKVSIDGNESPRVFYHMAYDRHHGIAVIVSNKNFTNVNLKQKGTPLMTSI